jgi:pimeloyl-ACP methyl ester carboxylesterase
MVGATVASAVMMAACGSGTPIGSSPTTSTTVARPSAAPNILTALTLVAHTKAGTVGYRSVGAGSPLVLITGFGASMDDWPPSFLDALAQHHQVIVFDNAGVGQTAPLRTSTITAMANQTSELISALRFHRTAVLGWSMGGTIAQAPAVEHPAQVSELVLAATQVGTGKALPIPPAAAAAVASPNPVAVLAVLFPPDQGRALRSYVNAIEQYRGFYQATAAAKASQTTAITQWLAGQDPAGREVGTVDAPTLVADGTLDQINPTANDRLDAASIPHATLILYPDAGHAFLFQDASRFVPTLEKFLG